MNFSFRLRWRWFRKELKKSDARMWFVACFGGLVFSLFSVVVLIFVGHTLNVNFSQLPPSPDIILNFLPIVDLRFFVKIGFFAAFILLIIGMFRSPYRIPYILFLTSLWGFIRIISAVITPLGIPEGSLSDFILINDVKSIWETIQNALFSRSLLFFSGHTSFPFMGFLIFSNITIVLQALLNAFNKKPVNWKKTIKTYFFSGDRIKVKTLAIPLLFITINYALDPIQWYWLAAILFNWIVIIAYKEQRIPLSTLFLIWSFLNALAVLLIRGHYSIDVLGAYFMTIGVYCFGLLFFGWLVYICESVKKDFKTHNNTKRTLIVNQRSFSYIKSLSPCKTKRLLNQCFYPSFMRKSANFRSNLILFSVHGCNGSPETNSNFPNQRSELITLS